MDIAQLPGYLVLLIPDSPGRVISGASLAAMDIILVILSGCGVQKTALSYPASQATASPNNTNRVIPVLHPVIKIFGFIQSMMS